ncbi:MAG: DUF547 domain-containing protein [Rhodospirillales bacterium]
MIKRRRLLLQAGALSALTALSPALALAAPRSELWPRWQAHDPASRVTVDHSTWAAFLDSYRHLGSDGVALIDYQGAQAARAGLHGYMKELSAVPVSSLNRDEQFAYWANLYNALTVATVLDHYPVDSIRDIDISSGLFANGPWGATLVEVEGQPLTLDDIEHRIMRPIWRDPRVHYAVNCAALGCPSLLAEPFTAATLEAQLEEGARAFINHPRGARVEDGELYVSSIYDWFQSDFGGSDKGVIRHLQTYAEPALAQQLAGIEEIAGDDYDWDLNDWRLDRGS